MIYILSAFAIFVIGLFIYTVNKYIKENWFHSLKPEDKIKVRIYSVNCTCVREASVIKPAVRNFINAELNAETQSKCKECAFINSKLDADSDITCWYKVNTFSINNVIK